MGAFTKAYANLGGRNGMHHQNRGKKEAEATKRARNKQKTTFPTGQSEKQEGRLCVATANPGTGGKAIGDTGQTTTTAGTEIKRETAVQG
jgi:hypothetical protein